MRATLNIFAMAVVAILVASCAKDPGRLMVVVEQPRERGKIELNRNQLSWTTGDTVSIYDGASNHALYVPDATGSNTPELVWLSGSVLSAAPYKAVYPSSIHTGAMQVNLPIVQRSSDGRLQSLPMYAEGNDENLKFYHLGGVVRFRLSSSVAVNLSTIAITTGARTTGSATVTGSGSAVRLGTPNGTTTTTLTLTTPQNIAQAKDFYMSLPVGSHTPFVITMTASNGTVCTKTANSAIVIERGAITTITLSNLVFSLQGPEGAVGGLFSVSGSEQVYFAKGNLQYQATTGTWRFAEHQYDIVGNSNTNISAANSGWIDLFGWGTSGWSGGATAYQPYSTSTDYTDYYLGGYLAKSMTGSYAHADWGVHNAIANGGNAAGEWRTLTNSQWYYLFYSRAGAAGKWGYATVAGVNGVIVLPDSFSDPMRNHGNGAFTGSATTGWSANVYTDANWVLMEAAGAVFLPAAGYRSGASVSQVGAYGQYWSTVYYDTYSAHRVSFGNSCLGADGYDIRSYGFAVRLVHD